MSATIVLRCPDTDRGPQVDAIPAGLADIIGCGRTFPQALEALADDPDGWADCPHCGVGFAAAQGVDPDDECYDAAGVALPYGRCDGCGAPCGPLGCTVDRTHPA